MERVDADVTAFYDSWKRRYLLEAGSNAEGLPLYRIVHTLDRPEETVSEGQGYGMLITVLLAGYDPDAQELFDGLWRYARAHPSDVDPRLMGWIQPPDGNGNDSAFDGDADMAYALLLADLQWGSAGVIDYRGEAITLLRAIRDSELGPESNLPMLGDWVDPNGDEYNQFTVRISDFMPDHFDAFWQFSSDVRWLEALGAVGEEVSEIESRWSRLTGLMPDFAVRGSDGFPRPAPPGFLEGPDDGAYGYNAGRYPWRAGTYALLGGDEFWIARMRKISHWAEAVTEGDPQNLRAGYTLGGRPLPDSDYFTTFFAAPLAVAATLNLDQQQWLDALYDAVRRRHEDYYEDSVTLLSMLVIGGYWWVP